VNRELRLEGHGFVVLRGIILPSKGVLIRALVNCGFAQWVDPPVIDLYQQYINYLEDDVIFNLRQELTSILASPDIYQQRRRRTRTNGGEDEHRV
jgi:hypothetical protein